MQLPLGHRPDTRILLDQPVVGQRCDAGRGQLSAEWPHYLFTTGLLSVAVLRLRGRRAGGRRLGERRRGWGTQRQVRAFALGQVVMLGAQPTDAQQQQHAGKYFISNPFMVNDAGVTARRAPCAVAVAR